MKITLWFYRASTDSLLPIHIVVDELKMGELVMLAADLWCSMLPGWMFTGWQHGHKRVWYQRA